MSAYGCQGWQGCYGRYSLVVMPQRLWNDIEAEFGVSVEPSGQISGLVGCWTCQIPGTDQWVRGEDPDDLRDELIKALRRLGRE